MYPFLLLLLAVPVQAQEKKPEDVKFENGKATFEENGLRYMLTVTTKDNKGNTCFLASFEVFNITEITNIPTRDVASRIGLPKLTDDRGQAYVGTRSATSVVGLIAPGKSVKLALHYNEPNPKAKELYFVLPVGKNHPARRITIPADLWKP